MLVGLLFQIELNLVHHLNDALLHSKAGGFDVVLVGECVALVHEFLNVVVDCSDFDNAFSSPLILGLHNWRHTSSSGNTLTLNEVVNVFIKSTPAWVTNEGNLAFLVDEDDVWDLLDAKVRNCWALLVLNVVVLHLVEAFFLDKGFAFGLVLINTEADSTDLIAPLGLVCGHHVIGCFDWHLAELAPGSPEFNENNFVTFVVDGDVDGFS